MSSDRSAADLVAIILAVGISAALLLMCGAALWAAWAIRPPSQLGENATQVLTGWGGGMIGVLGAYVGYRFGAKKRDDDATS